MTNEEYAELNYRLGHLPLKIYCQLNGKTPAENWELQKKANLDLLKQSQDKKQLYKQTQDEARQVIEKAIEDLLKDFEDD